MLGHDLEALALEAAASLARIDPAAAGKSLHDARTAAKGARRIALNNLAYIKAEEGTDLDEALTMAQRARQKLPDSNSIQDTLGWIYIKKNLSDDAVRVFRDLVKSEPANPSFHYHYGMALLQKGDKPNARAELEAAIRNKPSKDESDKIRQLLASN